jgi:hypothetical protein
MPLLRFFVAVGGVLTIGLFALSAYLEPVASAAGARVSVAPTTSSLLAFNATQFTPNPVKATPIKTSDVKPAPVKPTHVKVSHRSR